MSFLRIDSLHRRFKREVALDDLSLSIPKNSTTAFIGANGAGKTTTFAILGQFIRPHGGKVEIDGVPLSTYRAKGGVISVLPQDVQFYENRTIYRQLYLFARLAGLNEKNACKEVYRVLELSNLVEKAKKRASELSHGMKVRLGVAQALIGSPSLVLLDEPTAGLDPKMLQEFRKNLKEIQGTTTIMISSHDLSELQSICDHVCMIDKGREVLQGSMKEMLGKSSRVKYRLGSDDLSLQAIQENLPYYKFKLKESNLLVVGFDSSEKEVEQVNHEVLSWLLGNRIPVLEVEARKNLEQTFIEETMD